MFNLSMNFEKLRRDLLPEYKDLIPLLKVFCSGVNKRYGEFMSFRSDSHYQLRHNSQVIYLRKVLNDRFHTNLITIVDGVELTETYIYQEIEGQALVLYKDSENEAETTLYQKSEFEVTTDFIVQVPSVLNLTASQLIELKGLVTKYKLPNKHFEIEIV